MGGILSLQRENLHAENGLRATKSLTSAGRRIINGSIPRRNSPRRWSRSPRGSLLRISRWLAPRFAEDRLRSRSRPCSPHA